MLVFGLVFLINRSTLYLLFFSLNEIGRAPALLVKKKREQHMNQRWNCNGDIVMPSIDSCEINNPSCSKSNKRKSVYVVPHAEFSIQKREGLGASGRNSGLHKQYRSQQYNESRTNQHLMIQSKHKTNKQQTKSSSYGTITPVLRQNKQQRTSLVSKGKLAPNRTVSTQQGTKVIAGDSSFGRMENGSKVIVGSIGGNWKESTSKNKDFPQNISFFTKKNSTCEKVPFMSEKATDPLKKQVHPNVVMDEHIKWNNGGKDNVDVVSCTFTSSLVKPSANNSDTRASFCFDDITEKHYSDKNVGGSSVGLNSVNGDSLSILLENKLKELTLNDDPSIDFTRGGYFVPTAFTLDEESTSPFSNWGVESELFEFSPSLIKPSLYVDYCQSAQSSTKGQVLQWSKPQVEEPKNCISPNNGRIDADGEDLNPLSVFHPPFMSESCWSSQCLGSSNGNTIDPSSSEVNYSPMNLQTKNAEPVDMEKRMMDFTYFKSIDILDIFDFNKGSRKSKGTEMDYIEYILKSANHIKDELGQLLCKQEGSTLDPLLFDKLEEMNIHTEWKEPLDDYLYRRLLFDCVNECFEMRCLTYSWEGYVAWSKGMIATSKCIEIVVCSEISGWKSMGEWTQDELVEKDITNGLGTKELVEGFVHHNDAETVGFNLSLDKYLDELVEKDMSSELGKWVDFRVEALEVGEEVERDILSSLLDEVIGDICAGQRQRR